MKNLITAIFCAGMLIPPGWYCDPNSGMMLPLGSGVYAPPDPQPVRQRREPIPTCRYVTVNGQLLWVCPS